MNPRIAKKGKSFKGVMDYLMHDKREAGKAPSSDRVAFAHTHNLPTDDPKRATAQMIDLATHGHEIIIANGGKKPKSGSPVLHFSLGWHPKDKVTDDQMIEASIASLKKLGMHKHQAIFVKHLDGDHQHIHVVANRVHPETGVMNKLSNDRLKLSKLAQELNTKHKWREAEQRVENNKKRDQGEWVKHKEEATREQWLEDKARKAMFDKRVEADKKKMSKREIDERKALFQAKEEQIKQSRQLVKDANKSKWADLYAEQRKEKEELKAKTKTKWGMAKVKFGQYMQAWEKGGASGLFTTLLEGQKVSKTMDEKHAEQRQKLSTTQKAQTRDQMKMINKNYKQDRLSLDEMQRTRRSNFDKSVYEQTQAKDKTREDFDRSADNDHSQEHDRGRERTRDRGHDPDNEPH